MIVALIITVIVASYKKRQAYQEWITARGFSYDPGRETGWQEHFPRLAALRNGSDRYAFDFIRGEWSGLPLLCFHYHYETTSRDSKGNQTTHHHYLTVVSLTSPLPLKYLNIQPENVFHKVAGFFGAEDINFESAEFSRKYHVTADDRKWAYDVLHVRCIDYLLQRPRGSFQLDGNCITGWFSGQHNPQAIEEIAETMAGVVHSLPDYVKRELQEGAPSREVPA